MALSRTCFHGHGDVGFMVGLHLRGFFQLKGFYVSAKLQERDNPAGLNGFRWMIAC